MTECRRFVVTGRVQGVFYRASAAETARRLGVTGWAGNRADGAVEGLACGEAGALDTFGAWLWEGPDAARVTGVEITPDPAAQAPTGFATR